MREGTPKILGIIVGRMSSKRFPGKMAKSLCGVPLLEFVIMRAKESFYPNSVMVATSTNALDDRLAEIADYNRVECFRGDLVDVAGRLLSCATHNECDYFARINGDSPLLDEGLIHRGLAECGMGNYDIITNVCDRTYPYGISLEIIKTSVFREAYGKMNAQQREHPFSYFYDNKENFKLLNISNTISFDEDLTFTVDSRSDLENLNEMLEDDMSRTWKDFV